MTARYVISLVNDEVLGKILNDAEVDALTADELRKLIRGYYLTLAIVTNEEGLDMIALDDGSDYKVEERDRDGKVVDTTLYCG